MNGPARCPKVGRDGDHCRLNAGHRSRHKFEGGNRPPEGAQ